MEFVSRILTLFDRYDIHDMLLWRTGKQCGGGEYDVPATFFARFSDVFWWATADLQEITPENIGELEKALAECKGLDPVTGCIDGVYLFAARLRKMRPQGAMYGNIESVLWPLFDACGPERAVGADNPKKQPEMQTAR